MIANASDNPAPSTRTRSPLARIARGLFVATTLVVALIGSPRHAWAQG